MLGVHIVEQGGGDPVRHDWSPQYIANDFKRELKYFGLGNSPAFQHEPETIGVIERFIQTLRWECLWIETFGGLDEARRKISQWLETYNTRWLIRAPRAPHTARSSDDVRSQ